MAKNNSALPRIDRIDVEQALEEISGYSARKRPENPLQHLLIVDIFLANPAMPHSDEARLYALSTLLATHIEQKFFSLRRGHNLDIPPTAEKSSNYNYPQSIRLDREDEDLRAWSILYYCYVRDDLGIDSKAFAEIIGTVERNFNRFRADAIGKLLNLLISLEHEARLNDRKMRMRQNLPGQAFRLLGRDILLNRLYKTVIDDGNKHFHISGVNGVGKTSFINAFASMFIEGDLIDELVWIDKPHSVTYIERSVIERLIPEGAQTSLRGLMMREDYRTLIVCDGIDKLIDDEKSVLEGLLNSWDRAFVILTSQRHDVIQYVDISLILHDLDTPDAEVLAQRLLQRINGSSPDEATAIVADIGGNPRLLQAAIARIDTERWGSIRHRLQHDLLKDVFSSFDERMRIAWCVFALYPNGMPVSQLDAIWSSLIDGGVLGELRRHFVIDALSSTEVYHLSEDAMRFMVAAYVIDNDVKIIFSQLIEYIDRQIYKNPQNILLLSQGLLTHDWITLPEAQRREWIEMLWSYGISHGYAALWHIILENAPKSFEIRLAYSLCLRRLGNWDKAEYELDKLIRDSGSIQPPNFEFQSKALYERGIVSRYKGQYERASVLMQRAEATAQRLHNARLIENIHLERAHVAIERKLYDESNLLLGGLAMSPRVCLLLGESALGEGQIDACRAFIENGFKLTPHDIGLRAAFYNLLGRSYDDEQNYEKARSCFISSMILLEQIHDVVGLARTRGNLGVALMHIGEYQPASHLFTQSEQELIQLGDILGVTIMRHNHQILRGLQR